MEKPTLYIKNQAAEHGRLACGGHGEGILAKTKTIIDTIINTYDKLNGAQV